MKSQESVWMLPKISTFLFQEFKKLNLIVLIFTLAGIVPAHAVSFPALAVMFPVSAVSFPASAVMFPAHAVSFRALAVPFPALAVSFPAHAVSLPATQFYPVLAYKTSKCHSLRYPSERNSIIKSLTKDLKEKISL
jgi:hypothetical protein